MGENSSIEHFLSFGSLSTRSICIWPLPNAGYRLCTKPINRNLVRELVAQRHAILSQTSIDPIETLKVLREHAKSSCCARYHREKLSEDLLVEVSQRWLDELTQVQDRLVDNDNKKPSKACFTAIDTPAADAIILSQPKAGTQPYINKFVQDGVSSPDRTNICINTKDISPIMKDKTRSSPKAGELRSGKTYKHQNACEKSAYQFKPLQNKPKGTVLELLKKPLTKSERETENLYVYRLEAYPGFVKIGVTKNPVCVRLKQWEKQCGYVPQQIHGFCDVPYARRVEKLIHKELAKFVRNVEGCKCQTTHIEWYEVDESIVTPVMQNWVNWFKGADIYNSLGTLKDEWSKQLFELDISKQQSLTANILIQLQSNSAIRSKTFDVATPIKGKPSKVLTDLAAEQDSTTPRPQLTRSSTLMDLLQNTVVAKQKELLHLQATFRAIADSISITEATLV